MILIYSDEYTHKSVAIKSSTEIASEMKIDESINFKQFLSLSIAFKIKKNHEMQRGQKCFLVYDK